MSNIEQLILRNVITDDAFMRKVLPFIQPEYFQGVYNQLFKEVAKYAAKYNKMPTQEAFKIEIESNNRFSDDQYICLLYTSDAADE